MIFPLNMLWAMEATALRSMLQGLGIVAAEVQATIFQATPTSAHIVDGVAVVNLTGPLMKADDWLTGWLGGTSTHAAARATTSAASDKSVRAIVFNVDSPGGTVDGLAELGDTIAAATKVKRTVAQVNGMAASAAYYAASQAGTINAGRMDMVGSIGTILPLYDFSKAFEAEGVEAVPIESGPFKSAGMMGTEITKEQRAHFQSLVDSHFADFTKAVSTGRSMSAGDVRKLADGRMFMARDAKGNGLIDRIQAMDQTLASLAPKGASRRTRARFELARRTN